MFLRFPIKVQRGLLLEQVNALRRILVRNGGRCWPRWRVLQARFWVFLRPLGAVELIQDRILLAAALAKPVRVKSRLEQFLTRNVTESRVGRSLERGIHKIEVPLLLLTLLLVSSREHRVLWNLLDGSGFRSWGVLARLRLNRVTELVELLLLLPGIREFLGWVVVKVLRLVGRALGASVGFGLLKG